MAMTNVEKKRYIAMLREKNALIGKRMTEIGKSDDAAFEVKEMVLIDLETRLIDMVTLSMLKGSDADTEESVRGIIGREALNDIVVKLKSKHGFGRIAEDTDLVVRRVFKRGKINTEDEHRIVLDFLSSTIDGTKEDRGRWKMVLKARRGK